MSSLTEVWKQVEVLLSDNVSLIPVYDSPRLVKDTMREPKTPCIQWKKYTDERLTKQDLYEHMERFNTTGVAMIGGKISGNLEILDCDSKYHPGIDAQFFKDMQLLYPELLYKLRIHKTPSGGYHFLYRVKDHEIPGNQKLAGRAATPEELLRNPKERIKNFFETRGEGGYACIPPSMGYEIHTDSSIPVISWQERCSIVQLVMTYNEAVKPDKPPVNKTEDSYYDVNPWADYNQRIDATELMQSNGWTYKAENNHFIWYTRPGKDAGVSASFNKQKRVFWIFTSSTSLDQKGYFPSMALSHLQFGSDHKRTYQWLVEQGYGAIKPTKELEIIRNTLRDPERRLPHNLSAESVDVYIKKQEEFNTRFPHGVFWEMNDKGRVEINREKLYRVGNGLGLRWYATMGKPVLIDGKFVEDITIADAYNLLKNYIHDDVKSMQDSILSSYEAFIEAHGKFTLERLDPITRDAFINDKKDVAYKFYLNGILRITPLAIDLVPYEDIEGLVLRKEQQPRDYAHGTSSIYIDFLEKATNLGNHENYIRKCIGFLSHNYKDETTGYIILLAEACEDPKDGGGSGKNIFSKMFGQVTTYCNKPASQTRLDEKLFQSWNGERVFCVSDLPKEFDFSSLKEISTGDAVLKKLFKDERVVPNEELPKLIASTNYSYRISDGGVKRRVRAIEFTDFFTKTGGVKKHFNAVFPSDWTEEDWHGFDTFIAGSIQLWIAGGLEIEETVLSEGGWHKQFEQQYSEPIFEYIKENIDLWRRMGKVPATTIHEGIKTFIVLGNYGLRYNISKQRVNSAIADYCKHFNIIHNTDVQWREGYDNFRGHEFLENAPF